MVSKEILARDGVVLEVWIAENGKVCGTDDLKQIICARGTIKFSFRGKLVTYHVLTNDDHITRAQAYDFARAHFEGKLVRLSVDLRDEA